jgi:predicted Zn finger-like uncharacterized protein
MILSCNACEKKFVVPDQAITEVGRTVQCGSCGYKWKQYPIKENVVKATSDNNAIAKKISNLSKVVKPKKKKVKKNREISLYSPEYLEKKHGISLDKANTNINNKSNEQVSFGFYNSLILFIVIIITLSKCLHFFQDFLVSKLPFTEFYINYFFESIKNIFEISKSLVSNY